MRTKSLIVAAALLAAGVASSMAQSNVYSLNVVGYINLPLTNALTLVANQLDADGTGTNNLLTNVLNGVPAGTTVYKFVSGGFITYTFARGSWAGSPGFAASTATLNPGEACFVSLANSPYNTTITTVGQVLQGTWTNNLSGTETMVSSIAPLSGAIDSTGNGGLGYTPINGDTVFIWDNTLTPPNYDTYTFARGAWAHGLDPVLTPGVGFFLQTTQTSWTNTFTVQ